MHEEFQKQHCRICGNEIGALHERGRVPVVEPYASSCKDELLSLVGATVHIDCWADHHLWQEVARLAMADVRSMFRDGQTLLSEEYAGAWQRVVRGSASGIGAVFLPRSAYIYSNLLGDDVKGGFVSGTSGQISEVLDYLRLLKANRDTAKTHALKSGISVEPSVSGSSVVLGFSSLEGKLRVNLYLDDVRLLVGSHTPLL